MRKEFLRYTIEELLEDQDFIAWLLHSEKKQEWELFMAENPDFRVTVNKARKILQILHDKHDHFGQDEIARIWQNIEKFDYQTRKPTLRIRLYRVMRYAAILIVAVSIVSIGYLVYNKNLKPYDYKTSGVIDNQSHLILSNGKTVNLDKENSKVAMNSDERIVIDNEKVIDLSKEALSQTTEMNEIVVPYGKKSQLILEDGTKVWLNAGSRMAFPTKFSRKKREVFLEGEGYFEVAHNSERPFFVNTGEIAVKVLGTKFNVSAYKADQMTETVLLEGRVALNERSAIGLLKKEILMTPNQKASYDRNHRSMEVKAEPDASSAIAWTEGWLKFSKQNINDVLNRLNRYFNVEFVFDDKFTTDDLITGKLDLKDSVESVMIALSDIANIHYRMEGNKIYITRKVVRSLSR